MLRRWAKNVIFTILVLTGGFFVSAPVVFAQTDALSNTDQIAQTAGLGNSDLPSLVGRIISVFLGILGVVFLILFMYAGFVWMTAGGDHKKVEKAKSILINATIGIVITLGAYGITTFIVNALGGATGFGGAGGGGGNNGGVSVERLSGALGSGPIRDHFPARNQTDVPRNAKVMITFKDAIDPATVTASSVKIYPTAQGATAALPAGALTVNGTTDGKTFVLKPADPLGSASAKVQYTVALTADIKNVGGAKIFSGSFSGGYQWSFETGTVLDLTPPSIVTVTPGNSGTYSRNISVQAPFSEPIDPTSATGTRGDTSGFDNITVGAGGVTTPGTYEISNGYTALTFIPANPCGTNSCGQTIMCLPGSASLSVSIKSATTTTPPQADSFPYNGVVDMAGNSLDGNADGTAGDAYAWGFSTTGNIALAGPRILSVAPNISEESVPLDQAVTATFDGILQSSSVSSDSILLTNKELSSGTSHEMWYATRLSYLTASGEVVSSSAQVPVQTVVTIPHGTFLESTDGKSYVYGTEATQDLRNEYQNCYVPAAGPDASGGACGVSSSQPYCCNGTASAAACSLF